MLLNIFQVRLRAKEAPEDHVAEGTVTAEPQEVHPGDEFQVTVDVRFLEGVAPGAIEAKVSPPEDMTAGEALVEMGPGGATITIPASTGDEVELGTYYLQVVYSDDRREHFEAEASLEVKRHWVLIGQVTVEPARASPGDPVDVSVAMSFEGQSRVRGHVRGRLVPEDWDGDEERSIKLPRERSSVTEERQQTWRVRIPRGATEGLYHADVEFSSSEGTARNRSREVARVVPQRGIDATRPEVEPALLPPGERLRIVSRAENVGREELLVRVGAELVPEAGGTSVQLEERTIPLAPGEVQEVAWDLDAPERTGRWTVRVKARAEHTDGADPPVAVLDVRPPHQTHVIGAVPSSPWAAPGERVDVALQLVDSGSRPGSEATISVCLEGDAGETISTPWTGGIDGEPRDAVVSVEVPRPSDTGTTGEAGDGQTGTSGRFALVVHDGDGTELLRVPSAVAVRKRVLIEPREVRAKPDPTRLADCMLPGERSVATLDFGELTLVELSSGCRLYARGDRVAGVDEDAPMDDDFWDQALTADVGLYTDLMAGIQQGADAARAESMAMRALADAISAGEGSASGLIRDSRELARSLDPDRRARGVSPRSGPLAPLAAWLSDPGAHPDRGREIVPELRRQLAAGQRGAQERGSLQEAAAAARAAADHLERLAELLGRALDDGRIDAGELRAAAALVAATGVAQVELNRLRETTDPWASPEQLAEARKAAIQAMSVQLGALLEVMARHRARVTACTVNTRQRAAQAAVTRDLEVAMEPTVGHSGDATDMAVRLVNRSHIDLQLRLNVALPSAAWAVLEPQARGSEGLVFVGPVPVPARSSEDVRLVIYVPTTVRLGSYVLPIEVVPEPRDIVPEQRGGGKA